MLFLDEPTTGMDPEGRRDTAELVRNLRAEGTTVLLTTHYLEEAEQLADRLAIMQAGRIVASGTPEQVVAERPSRITFRLPRGVLPERLPLNVPAAVDGRTVAVRTHELQWALTELLVWARESGITLEGLQARSASLEEASWRSPRRATGRNPARTGRGTRHRNRHRNKHRLRHRHRHRSGQRNGHDDRRRYRCRDEDGGVRA